MTGHLLIAGAAALALTLSACGPTPDAQDAAGPAASLADTNPAASISAPPSEPPAARPS